MQFKKKLIIDLHNSGPLAIYKQIQISTISVQTIIHEDTFLGGVVTLLSYFTEKKMKKINCQMVRNNLATPKPQACHELLEHGLQASETERLPPKKFNI